MRWPLVSRAKYEALEEQHTFCAVRYEDLEKRYNELRASADRMLDAVLKPAPPPEPEPESSANAPVPRRPLGREIVGRATRHFEDKFNASKVKT
jgi:anti-sigma factor RsiW